MIFNLIEEKSLVERLLNWGIPQSLKRGDYVYREGDAPKGLYFIRSGLVGLIKYTPNGAESLIRLFKKDQFFGHRTLFADETYHGTAQCLEPTEILFCNKELVFKVFENEPKAYYFLARALAKELRRAEERSVIVSEGDILERVASALLLFKKMKPDHLWTRTEIASYCASRTPTVIKALGHLEELGAIQQEKRNIEILDENQLVAVLHGDVK